MQRGRVIATRDEKYSFAITKYAFKNDIHYTVNIAGGCAVSEILVALFIPLFALIALTAKYKSTPKCEST